MHVCYCHNPFRYAWNERHRTLSERGDPISRAALRSFFRRWREWDWIAAQRVDRYVTNSRTTQARIKAYFGRDSRDRVPAGRDRPLLAGGSPGTTTWCSRSSCRTSASTSPSRRSTQLGLPLVVVGDGPDRRRLRRLAGPDGALRRPRVGRARLPSCSQSCRALVVTAVEEFGIAAVEAQAAGRPVIAARGGGALETIVEGRTGCLWSGGPAELAAAVRRFDTEAIDPEDCVRNAARFDTSVFRNQLPRLVDTALADADGRPDQPAEPHPRGSMTRLPLSRRLRGRPLSSGRDG